MLTFYTHVVRSRRGRVRNCIKMSKKKVKEADILALAEGVLESKENTNNLVDLLDHLQVFPL